MRLSIRFARRAALALLVVSNTAMADPQWCTGKVQRVLHEVNGAVSVFMSYRNDWTYLCSTESVRGGVPVAVCKSWLASSQLAISTNMTAVVQYPEAPACHLLPSYNNAPAPSYFQLVSPTVQ
ncbi:hypothetical protein CDN99_11005 [Roseateles aquatilis]|uniref:Secreted protein n=1 Tax=Roseateles aquatilis TaxID=431061 RepID=A0A246JDH9_9BURK|nr:hypothetical protein [Roseateles aquatilis]OWQ90705.1 hypothetical protein CDN99_11005 [Roseateles aquatilis]